MFLFNKTERKLRNICNNIIVPVLPEFEEKKVLTKATRHRNTILRFIICLTTGTAIVFIVLFQSANTFKIKTNTANLSTNDSFALFAYAATTSSEMYSNNSENTRYANDEINYSTKTELKSNQKIILPVGKITRDYSKKITHLSGTEIYSYQFPNDTVFQFSGTDIDTITLKLNSGFISNIDNGSSSYKQFYDTSGSQMTLKPNSIIKWHLSYPDQYKIITNPNFSDFASISTDIVTITVKFIDGSTKVQTVNISFNNNGSLCSTLRND